MTLFFTRINKFRHKSRYRIAVALILMVLLLYWVFRDVSPEEQWQNLRHVKPVWIMLAFLFLHASFVIRALRWKTLLSGSGMSSTFVARLCSIYIGFACNCLLPAHSGELVRAWTLKRSSSVPFTTSLGSIAVERIFDIFMVL